MIGNVVVDLDDSEIGCLEALTFISFEEMLNNI